MPADEPRGRGLLDDDLYDVLAVEAARLAEEGLLFKVVVVGAVYELRGESTLSRRATRYRRFE